MHRRMADRLKLNRNTSRWLKLGDVLPKRNRVRLGLLKSRGLLLIKMLRVLLLDKMLWPLSKVGIFFGICDG